LGSSLVFEVVNDLDKYLGVPLLHKRVTKGTYQYLIHKVQQKLSGWKAKTLSLAARVTLVKAVFSALPMYFMQLLLISKGICKEMEKIIRQFAWGHGMDRSGINLVKWKEDVSRWKMGDLV